MESFAFTEATAQEIDTARYLVRAEAQIAALARRLAALEEWVEDIAGDVAGMVEGVA